MQGSQLEVHHRAREHACHGRPLLDREERSQPARLSVHVRTAHACFKGVMPSKTTRRQHFMESMPCEEELGACQESSFEGSGHTLALAV